MSDYFIRRGLQTKGPFSAQQMAEFFRAKRLKANDQVSKSEAGPWQRMAVVYREILAEAEEPDEGGDEIVFAAVDPVGDNLSTERSTEDDGSAAGGDVEAAGRTQQDDARLTQCEDCGHSVSKRAAACPQCGAPVASEADVPIDEATTYEIVEESFDSSSSYDDFQDEYEYEEYPVVPIRRSTARKRHSLGHKESIGYVRIVVGSILLVLSAAAVTLWLIGFRWNSDTGPQLADTTSAGSPDHTASEEAQSNELSINLQDDATHANGSSSGLHKNVPAQENVLPGGNGNESLVAGEVNDSAEGQKKPVTAAISTPKQKMHDVQKMRQSATVLRAPPGGYGNWDNATAFISDMWKLATNEFAFKRATEKLYVTTFDQKDILDATDVRMYMARNAIVVPGKYDFDDGEYSLLGHLGYWYQGEYKDRIFIPKTTEYVAIVMRLKVDRESAERFRKLHDAKRLSLTIWYRLKSVAEADSFVNPHMTDGRLAYKIAFVAEVVDYEVKSSN